MPLLRPIFLITVLILFSVGFIEGLGHIYIFSVILVSIGFTYQVIQMRKGLERAGLFRLFKSHVWIGVIVLMGITFDMLIK